MFLYGPRKLAWQMHSHDYVIVSRLGLILHPCQSETNYAIGRYAWQKDIWSNTAIPSRAVDGDDNPAFSGNSCAMINTKQKPWWAVDLGQVIRISRIVVTNRNEKRKLC